MPRKPKKTKKQIETLTHPDNKRPNIPTAEFQSVMGKEEQSPIRVAYERRNRDLDPQLVWRGKDERDGSDLVVQALPLYIQEKVHPKVLIDDLLRQTRQAKDTEKEQLDLFADFNGLPDEARSTEFYRHDANWTNRMILGDSLQVMASLAERERLRGKVQCIYLDPPYGIKFNSNFQWSTTSRDVKDGKADHVTREPEQVKAFRDTWRDGIHSYLTYLRDRLTVARDLLTESGSIFVQIGDENVHRVRAVIDEVFGEENFINLISFAKRSPQPDDFLSSVTDYLIWFGKNRGHSKFRVPFFPKKEYSSEFVTNDLTSSHFYESPDFRFEGRIFKPGQRYWSTSIQGMNRLSFAGRLVATKNSVRFKRYHDDFSVMYVGNTWPDVALSNFGDEKWYVVQTASKVIQRCILMTTDPGDLVLDPTCGSGTTAYVAEQWGRRWITIDTSRVALALARARIMGARYPYYLLADSLEGQQKAAEINCIPPP